MSTHVDMTQQLRELNQTVSVTSAPSKEPITKDFLRTHTQFDLDTPDVNTWLDTNIAAARRWAEGFTSRSFIQQTRKLTLDDFPGERIVVPRPPLSSVNSVEFTDTDGSTTTVSSSDYHVNTDDDPGRIVLKDNKDWPNGTPQTTQAVVVKYDAGYGSARSDVPEDIRMAIAQLASHWFEHRSTVTQGAGVPRDVPKTVEHILWPYRVVQLA